MFNLNKIVGENLLPLSLLFYLRFKIIRTYMAYYTIQSFVDLRIKFVAR